MLILSPNLAPDATEKMHMEHSFLLDVNNAQGAFCESGIAEATMGGVERFEALDVTRAEGCKASVDPEEAF